MNTLARRVPRVFAGAGQPVDNAVVDYRGTRVTLLAMGDGTTVAQVFKGRCCTHLWRLRVPMGVAYRRLANDKTLASQKRNAA